MYNTIILFLGLMAIGYSTKSHAQSEIEWSENEKLKWSDFQAIPDTTIFAFANTVYKIEILPRNVVVDSQNSIQNYEAITVVAQFLSHLSWVYKEDDNLLKHEQLHFDIAELHARKMRKEFEKMKKQKMANFDAYSAAYNRLWQACIEVQKRYDKETNHGIFVQENKKWERDIYNQLNAIK